MLRSGTNCCTLCTDLCVYLDICNYYNLQGSVSALKFPLKLHKTKTMVFRINSSFIIFSISEGILRKYNDALRLGICCIAYEYRRELTTHGNFLEDCLCLKRCKTGKIHIYLACMISVAGLVSKKIESGSVNHIAITFHLNCAITLDP